MGGKIHETIMSNDNWKSEMGAGIGIMAFCLGIGGCLALENITEQQKPLICDICKEEIRELKETHKENNERTN